MRFWGHSKERERASEELRHWSVNTVSSSERKVWGSLVLELERLSESSQLAIVSAWSFWKKFACASCILLYLSSSTGLLFYSSNNLSVEEDLLHLTYERCSVEEDHCVKRSLRSWQGMVLDLLRWKLHDMIILFLALLHAVVPSRGDLQHSSDKS